MNNFVQLLEEELHNTNDIFHASPSIGKEKQ